MKIDWDWLIITTAVLFVLFPWIVGIVEIIYWFFAGHWGLFVPWTYERAVIAIAWPFFWGSCFAGVSG